MTLARKILTGFIICTLILLVVAVFSFRNSEKFIATNQWVNHTHEVLYEFDQVLVASIDIETGTRGFVITGNEIFLEPYYWGIKNISTHLENIKRLTEDNPVQQKNIEELNNAVNNSLAYRKEMVDSRKKDFEGAYKLVIKGKDKQLQDEIRQTIIKCKRIEQDLLDKRSKESEVDARNFNLVFIVLLLVIILVLISVYIIISLNLKALKKAEKETADKNWTLAGNSELIKSMQGNKPVTELSQTIINHLTTYLNAQIGAIYITANDNQSLELNAAYAADKRKKDKTTSQFGQGLVGQAAAENRTILFTDIPTDYFNIDTSFGEVRPKNIITAPFVFENKVTGVIELGSIYDFTTLQKDYIQMISDSIAIAITSSQNREKTKELLEETQRQAEELETQQEELRQSNEELLVKTELLEKSEAELKAQQEELQQTNEELEEKATLLEEQKEKLEGAKTEIETKAKELETTSKYKSEFLANISHELRTPLNSILILSQLLSENKNNTLAEKEVEFSKNIYHSGNDLLNLINEILDLSKVESGKMELDIAEVPLQSITNNLSAMFLELAKNKSLDFQINVQKNIAPSITTDKQRLEQILKNLLSNAFKFTGKGGKITLTIDKPSPGISFRTEGLHKTEDILAISVLDTGIGIPKEKRAIIFEAFQQADGSTKRKYGGTGLGLSISRELAGILGGEIHLESEEGKGSIFTLYIPTQFNSATIAPSNKQVEIKERQTHITKEIKKIQPVELQKENAIDDRNNIRENDRVVLIIEDELDFALLLLSFVRERNYKGILANQGNIGLSFARHYRPDAILLDVKLPVMDGMEVLKLLKNDPDLRHIPVQIISSFDYRKKSMELGAFDYIHKPATISGLQKALDKIENFVNKKLKKLLIVEDNKQQNKAISELIGNGDVKCFSAYSGEEAQSMLDAENYDCMIVDLGLPDMSGVDLLEKIKLNSKLNQIPIIVYTGKDLSKEENVQLTKLADTIVLKTANSQERLLDEAILFLHKVESKLPKEKQNMIRKLHKTDEILKNKTILLVDDDIRNIYSLSNVLEDEGVHCLIAENGKAAIQALKDNPAVDLVLMDVMMPEMDGYEATLEIRKMNEHAKLPIIALTAKAMKGDKEKCLAVGMSDYISKPVNIEQLLSLMRVWLYK